MKNILLFLCCILCFACKDNHDCCDTPRRFHFTFTDSIGQSLDIQEVIVYNEHQKALPVQMQEQDNKQIASFGLSKSQMNQELSFEIPSFNYQGNFQIKNGLNEFEVYILFNNQEFPVQEGHSISRFFILELPL